MYHFKRHYLTKKLTFAEKKIMVMLRANQDIRLKTTVVYKARRLTCIGEAFPKSDFKIRIDTVESLIEHELLSIESAGVNHTIYKLSELGLVVSLDYRYRGLRDVNFQQQKIIQGLLSDEIERDNQGTIIDSDSIVEVKCPFCDILNVFNFKKKSKAICSCGAVVLIHKSNKKL